MFKKLALSLAAIAAVSSLIGMSTFALFSAQASNQNNTFSSGTVTLGSPSGCTNNFVNMAPGDTGAISCAISYTGSLDAWLGVDLSTSGDLFGGATPLQISNITDSKYNNSYAQTGVNQLVGSVSNGDSVTLTADYTLPLLANNDYQGKQGTFGITFHAVQKAHNGDAAGNGVVWQ